MAANQNFKVIGAVVVVGLLLIIGFAVKTASFVDDDKLSMPLPPLEQVHDGVELDGKVRDVYVDSLIQPNDLKLNIYLTRYHEDSVEEGKLVHLEVFADVMGETLIQEFWLDSRGTAGMYYPLVYDYNNDGFYDYSFKSVTAARGANEIRRVFLFKPELNKFVELSNAQKYPNLTYNKSMQCLSGYAVYAGTMQSFLHIKHDSLVRFLDVEHHRFVRTVRKFDGEKFHVLSKDSLGNDVGFPYYESIDTATMTFVEAVDQ